MISPQLPRQYKLQQRLLPKARFPALLQFFFILVVDKHTSGSETSRPIAMIGEAADSQQLTAMDAGQRLRNLVATPAGQVCLYVASHGSVTRNEIGYTA